MWGWGRDDKGNLLYKHKYSQAKRTSKIYKI